MKHCVKAVLILWVCFYSMNLRNERTAKRMKTARIVKKMIVAKKTVTKMGVMRMRKKTRKKTRKKNETFGVEQKQAVSQEM